MVKQSVLEAEAEGKSVVRDIDQSKYKIAASYNIRRSKRRDI